MAGILIGAGAGGPVTVAAGTVVSSASWTHSPADVVSVLVANPNNAELVGKSASSLLLLTTDASADPPRGVVYCVASRVACPTPGPLGQCVVQFKLSDYVAIPHPGPGTVFSVSAAAIANGEPFTPTPGPNILALSFAPPFTQAMVYIEGAWGGPVTVLATIN